MLQNVNKMFINLKFHGNFFLKIIYFNIFKILHSTFKFTINFILNFISLFNNNPSNYLKENILHMLKGYNICYLKFQYKISVII